MGICMAGSSRRLLDCYLLANTMQSDLFRTTPTEHNTPPLRCDYVYS